MHKTIARLEDTSHGTLLTLKHTQCFDKSKILGTNARVTALPETVTNAKHFCKPWGWHLFRAYFCTIIEFWTVDSDLGEIARAKDTWMAVTIFVKIRGQIFARLSLHSKQAPTCRTRKSCTLFLKLFSPTPIFQLWCWWGWPGVRGQTGIETIVAKVDCFFAIAYDSCYCLVLPTTNPSTSPPHEDDDDREGEG